MDRPEQVAGTILGPDGAPAAMTTVLFSAEEAATFRAYKKLLQRHGLKEALFCQTCSEGNLGDGCEAHVTSSQILVKCRCRQRFYQGQSF